ncbi:MAG: amidohydrolase family protein [Verrucomicrobiales bacterium]|nr:amidohydrolase family protein [Verrucomicrobiales bacterium]
MEIWDLHAHLSGVPGDTPESRLGHLLEYADRMGVARLCVFMGMEWSYDPTPEKLRQENDEVLRAIRAYPERAFGFVYLNPRHTQASLDELNRYVRDGPMVGVKLWVAERCHSALLDPIVDRARELGALIFQHTWIKITGNLPGESTPMDLVALARRHPNASFVCGHSGGDWEVGLRTIRGQTNIHADLGGGDPAAGLTEMAVRELGADRVLYGSDIGGRSFASQLAKVHGADLPLSAKRAILGANLRRLLSPMLRSKGVKV